jgi:hypothetical protein
MDPKFIDTTIAGDLQELDIIEVPDFNFVTVERVEFDNALVYVYTNVDREDPFTFAWDDRLNLYGY